MTLPALVWSKLEPLPDPEHGKPCARSSHGVSIVNNRIVLYGGENVARTPLSNDQACWVLDLNSDNLTWRMINCSDGPPARVAHSQTAHRNNVYIFGGRAGITMNEQAMNDMWMLDCSGEPGTEKWMPVQVQGSVLPQARSFHRMICISEKLYVFGGCGTGSGRLADLHEFDPGSRTWRKLRNSSLRGRGGPNVLPISTGNKIAVVGGFCGEESADGQVYDISRGVWEEKPLTSQLTGMRPRSVCVCAAFASLNTALIFGGEVDPSDRGHEGAGGFANDLVLLDESTCAVQAIVEAESENAWPCARGWADGASVDNGGTTTALYLFGGLTGDDENPERLDDLWRLDIKSSTTG